MIEAPSIPSGEAAALAAAGAEFYARGWSYATSSNYSVRLNRDPLRLLITASGRDKGRLGPGDFVIVDDAGRAVDASMPKPSAETLLHVVAARLPEVGAVLHTHSVWGTILSNHFAGEGAVLLEGYEMLKGLEGIGTHETRLRLEVFPNTQDIAGLARRVELRLTGPVDPIRHGYLIQGHGLYTWGRTLAEARRHIEVLEFLFEVVGRQLFGR